MNALAKRLWQEETGATVVEFAIIAPLLCVTLLGLFDLSYNYYAETIIEGAVQKAARDATIDKYARNPTALDNKVRNAVQNAVPSAAVSFTRTGYSDYADVGRPEEFTDSNDNGKCDNNEPFEDINGNRRYDTDRALDSSAGARTAVVYEATATYDRAFPLMGLIGLEDSVSIVGRTVLRNQPFNATEEIATVGNCK